MTVLCPWVSKIYNLQPNIEILVKNNNGTTKNRIAFISMAAILYFSILGLIPHFDSVDPVLIGFSMLRTPYMEVFMLSSGSAHVGLLMLHIDSAITLVIWGSLDMSFLPLTTIHTNAIVLFNLLKNKKNNKVFECELCV